MGDRHEFGEGAGAMKAGLPLEFAHLCVASHAVAAVAAAADEGDRYPLTDLNASDRSTDLDNGASELVPRHMWQHSDVIVVALPAVPIAATQSGGGYLDHHPVWTGDWLGTLR
jgi:hypothetical protein